MRQQMHSLERIKEGLKTLPDGQVSMTDPDTRSMATSGKVSGMAVRWRGWSRHSIDRVIMPTNDTSGRLLPLRSLQIRKRVDRIHVTPAFQGAAIRIDNVALPHSSESSGSAMDHP